MDIEPPRDELSGKRRFTSAYIARREGEERQRTVSKLVVRSDGNRAAVICGQVASFFSGDNWRPLNSTRRGIDAAVGRKEWRLARDCNCSSEISAARSQRRDSAAQVVVDCGGATSSAAGYRVNLARYKGVCLMLKALFEL